MSRETKARGEKKFLLYSFKEAKEIIRREINQARRERSPITKLRRFLCPEEKVGATSCCGEKDGYFCNKRSSYILYVVEDGACHSFCNVCAAAMDGAAMILEDRPICDCEGCGAMANWRTRRGCYCHKHLNKQVKIKQSLSL